MGIFQAINAWNQTRHEKHVALMQEKGLCPDCRGRGYNAYMPHEYSYHNIYDCQSCNGTGSFTDWAETNNTFM
jgi:DnaJ-class molecular chaperone